VKSDAKKLWSMYICTTEQQFFFKVTLKNYARISNKETIYTLPSESLRPKKFVNLIYHFFLKNDANYFYFCGIIT